jgi:hypothetical protein
MLGAASIGAVFTSTSADFGTAGVVDRFGQVEPKVLVAADGYLYGGKTFDRMDQLRDPRGAPFGLDGGGGERARRARLSRVAGASLWDEFVGRTAGRLSLRAFPVRSPPLHPLLVGHHREAQVHRPQGRRGAAQAHAGTAAPRRHQARRPGLLLHDLRLDDVELAGVGLATGATIVLFDGNPFHPGPEALFDLVDELDITLLGVSAKYIDAVLKSGLRPIDSHRCRRCGRSPPPVRRCHPRVRLRLRRDQVRRAPRVDLRRHRPVRLFRGRRPHQAGVRRRDPGQGAGDGGGGVRRRRQPSDRVQGELVCTEPFPSMPITFWGEDGDERTGPPTSTGSRGVDPRRLRHVDRAGRHGDPRPLRRHPQRRRGADRHRRDLPSRRAVPRGAEAVAVAQRRGATPGGAVRADGRGRELTPIWRPRSAAASAPRSRPATSGDHRHRRRHPPHPERQDLRTGGDGRRQRRPGQEHRGPRQPRGTRPLPEPEELSAR